MAARPLLLAALLLAAAAPPPPPAAVSQAAEQERRLSDASVAAGAQLRDAEAAVTDAAARVAALADRRRVAEQRLGERAAALAPLLPLAERLGLFPAETMLAVPVPMEDAVRGLAVLQGLMRTVERQAADLRTEIDAVDTAQRALDEAMPQLRAAQDRQALEAAKLDRQLDAARAERARIEDAAAEEAKRAAVEAQREQTVRDALAAMADSRARAERQLQQDADRAARQRREAALALAQRRQSEVSAPIGPGVRQGAGVMPVAGPVVRRWGERTDTGPAQGIALRAPPKGRVVAPCAGRVAFAGPFRSYGVLVIVNCGGGYHFVLAGLDRLDTEPGASVRPGEPLGVMPDWDPAGTGSRPSLYVELRRDGEPVDPGPFLSQ